MKMDVDKRKETVAKILEVLNGFSYAEAHDTLILAQDQLAFNSFLSVHSLEVRQECLDKRQCKDELIPQFSQIFS